MWNLLVVINLSFQEKPNITINSMSIWFARFWVLLEMDHKEPLSWLPHSLSVPLSQPLASSLGLQSLISDIWQLCALSLSNSPFSDNSFSSPTQSVSSPDHCYCSEHCPSPIHPGWVLWVIVASSLSHVPYRHWVLPVVMSAKCISLTGI